MTHHDLDLPLDISRLAGPGRRKMEMLVSVVGPIRDADLALLQNNREIKPQLLKKITQRHHGLARSIASGVGHGEAAIIHGYELNRVSILMGDPAFVELVEFYKEKVDGAFVDVAEHMAALSKDALIALQERLEEDPEAFTNRELLAILSDMADRTGFGKQSTQVNVNYNLGARLELARKRALESRMAEANEAGMKDITPDE